MTARDAIRKLRLMSRSQIADLTPELAGELADVFEDSLLAAEVGSNFNDEAMGAVSRAEETVRRAMDRIGVLNDAIESKVTAAVSAEREACAKLAEEFASSYTNPTPTLFGGLAMLIRSHLRAPGSVEVVASEPTFTG